MLTDASVYEPVFDFAIDRSGKIGFRYDGEMIARSLDKLNYEKIEVNYIDKSIMKKINFSVRTSDDRVIDLNGVYSNSQEQDNPENNNYLFIQL